MGSVHVHVLVTLTVHRFNQVFDHNTKQDDVFEGVARGVIDK